MTPQYGGGFGVPTWIDALLRALAGHVAGEMKLTADRVFLSLVPDDLHLKFPAGDRFLTHRPGRFVEAVGVGGGGRQTSLFAGSVVFTLFRRQAGDQELRDARRLAREGDGALADLHALVSACQQWDGGKKLTKPATVSDFAVLPRSAGDQAWAVCPVSVQLEFRADLPTPLPAP